MSVDGAVGRGIPAIFSSFVPLEVEAAGFAQYLKKVEANDGDAGAARRRATVMRYVFVGESKHEAREAARQPFEWRLSRLGALTIPPGGEFAALLRHVRP